MYSYVVYGKSVMGGRRAAPWEGLSSHKTEPAAQAWLERWRKSYKQYNCFLIQRRQVLQAA